MDQKGRMALEMDPIMAAKNIVIIGFMGVGKSTLGQMLAEKLHWNFIDLDEVIEEEFGCSIPEIFEIWGEQAFRDKERELATLLCSASSRHNVIALGGGAFAQDVIREHCMAQCTVVLLDLSWEEWRSNRLPKVSDTRPLLQHRSIEGIEQLFHRRRQLYSHHYRFSIDGMSPEAAVQKILADLMNQIPMCKSTGQS